MLVPLKICHMHFKVGVHVTCMLSSQGFGAYRSFLELEVSLTHPVVVTFCNLLNQSRRKRVGGGDHDVERQNGEGPVDIAFKGSFDHLTMTYVYMFPISQCQICPALQTKRYFDCVIIPTQLNPLLGPVL